MKESLEHCLIRVCNAIRGAEGSIFAVQAKKELEPLLVKVPDTPTQIRSRFEAEPKEAKRQTA